MLLHVTRRVYPLLLVLTTLALAAYHVFGYAGHFGYDDMFYAKLAAQLNAGTFHLNDEHFGFRWGLLFPLAFSYKIFGINDHASALPAMAATLLTTVLVAYTLRERLKLQVMAVALFVLNPWTIYYSDKIMPDCLVALAVLGAIVSIYRQRFVASHQAVMNAALLSASLMFGVLSKESILLTAPLFVFILLSDLLQRRQLRFWLYATIFLVIAVITYLLIIKLLTGNFMSRMDAIEANSYLNQCSYDQLPIINTVKRIGWELLVALTRSGMAVPLIFALIGLVAIKPVQIWRMPDARSFFTVCAALALLCANFMSTSLTSYVPLCPDIRHYLFIIPLAAVAGAYTLSDFIHTRRFGIIILAFLAVTFIISFVNGYEYTYFLYAPMILFVLLRLCLPAVTQDVANALVGSVVLILSIAPVRDMVVNSRNGYIKQRAFIQKHVLSLTKPSVVITDVVQQHYGEYYIGFDSDSTVKFFAFRDLPLTSISDSTSCYLLSTGITRWMSATDSQTLPEFARDENELLLVAEEDGIKMYRIEARMLR